MRCEEGEKVRRDNKEGMVLEGGEGERRDEEIIQAIMVTLDTRDETRRRGNAVTSNSTETHYNTIHDTTLRYNTIHNTTLHYIAIQYTTLHSTALHYTTITILYYTTLHYTTLHYTTLHYIRTYNITKVHCIIQ